MLERHAADIYAELQAVESLEELGATISGVSRSIGFDGFTFIHLNPNKGMFSLEQRPVEWMDRYDREGYAPKDPLVIQAVRSRVPFSWREREKAFTQEQRRIMAEAQEFGLSDGYMIPIQTAMPERAFLNFFSSRQADVKEILRAYRTDLDIFALMVYSAYLHKVENKVKSINLTVRERECLLWAARGKTVGETATILGVSANTIKAHIKHAAHKLNAVNKTHAVVRAIYLQLIDQ